VRRTSGPLCVNLREKEIYAALFGVHLNQPLCVNLREKEIYAALFGVHLNQPNNSERPFRMNKGSSGCSIGRHVQTRLYV
jgi:hypothetical protein